MVVGPIDGLGQKSVSRVRWHIRCVGPSGVGFGTMSVGGFALPSCGGLAIPSGSSRWMVLVGPVISLLHSIVVFVLDVSGRQCP